MTATKSNTTEEPIVETIKFYKGDENRIVIEQKDYEHSMFRDQYVQALQIWTRICSMQDSNEEGVGETSNIITFCGDRGEGKTSCLMSVRHILVNERADEIMQLCALKPSLEKDDILALDLVDPSFFDTEHNIIELLLGQMYKNLEKDTDPNNKTSNGREKMFCHTDLLESFREVKQQLDHVSGKETKYYDPIEEVGALADGVSLKQSIETLFDKYLTYFNKKKLLICIDDVDLNMKVAYTMTEQIRKYLTNKKCVLLIAVKVEQLEKAVQWSLMNEIAKDEEAKSKQNISYDMAAKYVTKLLPHSNRVNIQKVREICEKQFELVDKNESKDKPKGNNKNKKGDKGDNILLKEYVLRLIFLKTRFLFYNSKNEVSPIVPTNLRSLRHLLATLDKLPDFESNEENRSNKQVFLDYFFQVWTNQLTDKRQEFAKRLEDAEDISAINKMVVSEVNEEMKALITPEIEKSSATGKVLEAICRAQNPHYNVSVGDALCLIRFCERQAASKEDQLFLFFLKSFYSIRLYEYYDVITEIDGQLQPVVDEVAQTDHNIYRIDTRFDGTNKLQRFVNGAMFTYAPAAIMPAKSKPRITRDLTVSSGTELAKHVKFLFEKYDDYRKDEKLEEKFKKELHLCEFFAWTLTHHIKSEWYKANTFDNPRDQVMPYYTGGFNSSMKYLCFNVLAPFCNAINVKYAYSRVNALGARQKEDSQTKTKFFEADELYKIAIEYPNSLLNQMIQLTTSKNPEKFEDDSAKQQESDRKWNLRRLASDSIIRNADVQISLMDRMDNDRESLRKNSIDEQSPRMAKLLAIFYNSIKNSEMKTYPDQSDRPYVMQFKFLLPLISYLEQLTVDDNFEKMFIGSYVELDEFDKQSNLMLLLPGLPKGCNGRNFKKYLKAKYPSQYDTIGSAFWRTITVNQIYESALEAAGALVPQYDKFEKYFEVEDDTEI